MFKFGKLDKINETMDTTSFLLNMIDDYLFVFNKSGKLIEVNNSAILKLGYSFEELYGKSILSIYPSEIQSDAAQSISDILEGKTTKCAYPLLSKEGKYIPVEAKLYMGKWLGEDAVFGIYKDRTGSCEQQLLLKSILDTVPDLVFYKNVESTYLGCNKAFAQKINGIDESEIIGKTDYDFVKNKEMAEFFRQKDREVFETCETKINEETVQLPDGKLSEYETVKTPFFDVNGKVSGLIGIARDISERKSMEKKLKESEFRLNLATSSTKVVLWNWNMNTNTIELNGQFTDIFGYSTNDIKVLDTTALGNFIHPEDIAKFRTILERNILNELECHETELRVKNKQGQWIWILIRSKIVEWDENNTPVRMVGTSINIDRIKKIEEKLIEKEKILSAVSISIMELLDCSDYLTAVYKAFDMLGSSTGIDRACLYKKDAIGSFSLKVEWGSNPVTPSIAGSSSRILSPDDWEVLNDPKINEKIYFGNVKNLENGGFKDFLKARSVVSLAFIPIYINGEIWGCIKFDDCSTEREWSDAEVSAMTAFGDSLEKAIEKNIYNEELKESKVAAETASSFKSQFLANMSHEIRTPISGIIGFMELLSKTELSREQSDYLREIKSASETLLLLINDILDYSKIEANKLELDYTQFDIHLLIKESVALFKPKVTEKGIEIIYNISKSIPGLLYGDPLRLKQVMYNLISNAVKFTHNGSIQVNALLLNESTDSAKIQILVKDTGIGMHEEVLSKLFTVYTQADTSTTRNFGGTGLGLAITRSIIHLFGGNIRVESTPNKGSTFYVEIDLKKDRKHIENNLYRKTELNIGEQASDKAPKSNPYTVLLVEDTVANQKLATIILKQLGYDVELAENGQQAVYMCMEKKYDIILMDCQMPVMDGYQASINIRNHELNKDTVIIAMTANAMQGDKDKCLASGMNDYISKPIIIPLLDSIIKKWIG